MGTHAGPTMVLVRFLSGLPATRRMVVHASAERRLSQRNSALLSDCIFAGLTGLSLREAASDVAWVVLCWHDITEESLASMIFSFGTVVHK